MARLRAGSLWAREARRRPALFDDVTDEILGRRHDGEKTYPADVGVKGGELAYEAGDLVTANSSTRSDKGRTAGKDPRKYLISVTL